MASVKGQGQGEAFDLQACPYDISHYVRRLKLFAHLTKCRKNYVKKIEAEGRMVEYFPCKYNSLHNVPLVELPYHEENCVSRFNPIPMFPIIENPTIVISPPPPNEEDIRKFKELAAGAKDVIGEDWDVDCIVNPMPTFKYNPAGVEEIHRRVTMNAASSPSSCQRAAQTQQSTSAGQTDNNDPVVTGNKLAYMLHESDEEIEVEGEPKAKEVPQMSLLSDSEPKPKTTPTPLPRTIVPTPNPLYHYVPINRSFESPCP